MCVCVYRRIICYPTSLFVVVLLYILLYLEQKYDQRNIWVFYYGYGYIISWVYYFNDLINLCIAFGLHKASRQILKYGDILPWSLHGVVSGSFMRHWRAVHGLLYFRDGL